LPDDLLEQLKSGGKMVIPVNNDILEVTKNSTNDYEITTHSGFVFVPLTSVKRLEI
jgi:protein-L-isoaspartate O-methyltransferase